MKKIIVSSLFVAGLSVANLAVAETGAGIEEFKQKLTAHVDSEITILSQFKVCIQAAQNRADFETCKNTKNQAQKKKILEMKTERLENRKKQLTIQEKQLNDTAKAAKK